jgi:hypothetical protein
MVKLEDDLLLSAIHHVSALALCYQLLLLNSREQLLINQRLHSDSELMQTAKKLSLTA